jgi:hypothetical protein
MGMRWHGECCHTTSNSLTVRRGRASPLRDEQEAQVRDEQEAQVRDEQEAQVLAQLMGWQCRPSRKAGRALVLADTRRCRQR